jgi:hypothetical protein
MTLQMDKKDMQAHRQRHKTADGGFHSHTLWCHFVEENLGKCNFHRMPASPFRARL